MKQRRRQPLNDAICIVLIVYDKQIFGIPMGTYCALLIAELFSFCYKKRFYGFHSYNKEAEIIQAFKSTA